jgi:transposase-like protein
MDTSSTSTREHWRRIIRRQQRSGLSVAQFCREQHVAQSSLFAWKRRLATESRVPAGGASPFVLVQSSADVPAAGTSCADALAIELHLPRGRHLLLRPGFDAPTLAAVLAVLDGSENP